MKASRTGMWGEAPLSWGSSTLATWLSPDGSRAQTIHADGAWVAWRLETGEVERVVARFGDLVGASLLTDGASAVVVRHPRLTTTHELEHVDATGARRALGSRFLGTQRILWAPDERTFAAAASGFAGLRTLHTITGEQLLADGRARERWLAIGSKGERASVREIPHPDGYRVLGYQGDGSPIEEIGPSSFELHVTGPDGEMLIRETLVRGGHDASATFSADGTRVYCGFDGGLAAFALDTPRRLWCVEIAAPIVSLSETRRTLYASGWAPESTCFVAISTEDGTTRWRKPFWATVISEDESTAALGLTVYDVASGRTRFAPKLPAIQMLAISRDGARIAAKACGTLALAGPDDRWQIVDGVSSNETLLFDPDGTLLTGEGRRWTFDEAGTLTATEPCDARFEPWAWSSAGTRMIAQVGERRSGSLSWLDRSGTVVAPLPLGSRDAAACFDGEVLVVFHLGQIWRYAAEAPSKLVHPPRGVEKWFASDNVIAAITPTRLLLVDRRTTARFTPPDRTPAERRLRVLDLSESEPTPRVLRRWSHREAEGEPRIALSPSGRLAADAIVGRPEVRVWDLETCALLDTIDLTAEGDGVSALAMTDRVLAIGTTRGRVLRFELDRGPA